MTFLPIVDRELRVAARRRGTYSIRLLVALAAILTGIVIFLVNLGATQQTIGRNVFIGLAVLSMIYCAASGRISTADCLSGEKREGTLGLLFLTDLKGYDVVLGKLVATSLNALYGLLAMLPVLGLPLLLGGTSSGEYWRVVLVLLDTFLYSLAIGMFASAISRDARRASEWNFGVAVLLMGALPVACSALVQYAWGVSQPGTLVSCPFYTFYLCDDTHYKAHPGQFWWSLGVIHGLTWLLLALASWVVPHAWQDKPSAPARAPRYRFRALWRAWSYGDPARLPAYRARLLNAGAYYWLTARARLKPVHVWTFLGLLGAWWTWIWVHSTLAWFDPLMATTPVLLVNTTLKAWIAIEASQQLAEDQKAGALELLLSTPLSVRDVVRGQFLALRRQFLKPVLLVIGIELIFMAAQMGHASSDEKNRILFFWLAGVLMLVADAITLPLVALRVALTAKSPNRATVTTIARVLVLPWFLFGAGAGVASVWIAMFSNAPVWPGEGTYLGLWFGAGMVVDLLFGLTAWWQLLHRFRQIATRQFAPKLARATRRAMRRSTRAAALGATSSAMTAAPPDHLIPPRSRRKKALSYASVVAMLLGGAFLIFHKTEPEFPPPLLVSITHSNQPVRVFAGWPLSMILPDGSLWRWDTTSDPVTAVSQTLTPRRVGTNCDWLQVSSMGNRNAGLRKDGTLWRWGSGPVVTAVVRGVPIPGSDPHQVDGAHDWFDVSTGVFHCVALKRNGTLWAWGDNSHSQLGNGPGPNPIGAVQVGTNTDWTAVTCLPMATLALRANGTLWMWGQFWSAGSGGAFPILYPAPTQFTRETNWTAVGPAFFEFLAWTSSGEIWKPVLSSVNALAPASATCQIVSSNALPDHLAVARCPMPRVYEVRPDGSLWEKSYPLTAGQAPSDEKWRRVGARTDWIAVRGDGGTAIGLTADNTLWTWGIDPSRQPSLSFGARLQRLAMRFNELFGLRRRAGGGVITSFYYSEPGVQKTPRPLMKMIFTNPNPVNPPLP